LPRHSNLAATVLHGRVHGGLINAVQVLEYAAGLLFGQSGTSLGWRAHEVREVIASYYGSVGYPTLQTDPA